MIGLAASELELLRQVFARHAELNEVRLFGSRAKGTHQPFSDVDLAVWGLTHLQAAGLAGELDELPLPYRFDVVLFSNIGLETLREHIERVGQKLYP